MQTKATIGIGAAALDAPPQHGNLTRTYVDPADANRYLRMRRAEFTCRCLGAALRQMREARGLIREAAAKVIGIAKGTLEKMEHGDPMVGMGIWYRAWEWMGVLDDVEAAARGTHASIGAAVRAHRESVGFSQTALAHALECSRTTVEELEDSQMTVRIHYWISAWREMGIDRAVVDRANPALRIRAEDAEAATKRAAEPPPEVD
jgi:DNA-binding XRE family transcriptional regulator